ncbi:MAG: anhydro-N-acetylmuramic acid kinase [Acidobacteria bacterium]|nr:anhydro-N-acetylmuramic acid kinase [Acidobacteriota bacterium]
MLAKIREKTERIIIGINSGTSADGIDAAIVKIRNSGLESEIEVIGFEKYPYSPSLSQRLNKDIGQNSAGAAELCIISSYLGELFAYSAKSIAKKYSVPFEDIDAIGMHGQTIYHHPEPLAFPGYQITGTMQIGNAAIVAERTGKIVVSDFRSRDMAVGGQGAPLVAYLDFVLFSHRARGRILLNIGGVANATGIPASSPLDSIIAFDTGPGNALIDAAVFHFSEGKKSFDENGVIAKQGVVIKELLKKLLSHPYFKKDPPKSLDKETFGRQYFQKLIKENPSLPPANTVATLTEFTIKTISLGIKEHIVQKDHSYEEIIVSGGGANNKAILDGLKANFPNLVVNTIDDYPILGKAKEAVLYAFLANETLMNKKGNVPSATGAKKPVILGSITPGEEGL